MDGVNGNSPPTILVVEDFEDNRFMMRRLLEMSGYRVLEAVNGEEAVNLACRELPELILMDLSLPQLDGLAATFSRLKLPVLENEKDYVSLKKPPADR